MIRFGLAPFLISRMFWGLVLVRFVHAVVFQHKKSRFFSTHPVTDLIVGKILCTSFHRGFKSSFLIFFYADSSSTHCEKTIVVLKLISQSPVADLNLNFSASFYD